MNKIVVIPAKYANYTGYLGSMYHYMSNNLSGCRLFLTDEGTEDYLHLLYEKRNENSISFDQKRSFGFQLRSFDREIADFEYINYPYGVTNDTSYDFAKDIDQASCCVLLISGETFTYEGDPGKKQKIRASDIDEYMQIVHRNMLRDNYSSAFRLLFKCDTIPPIVITVTNTEIIPDEYVQYLPVVIRNIYSVLFEHQIVMLNAVSTEFMNSIAYPIEFGLINILCRYIVYVREMQDKNTQEIYSMNTTWQQIVHMHRLEELRNENDKLKHIISQLKCDVVKLLDLFDEEKIIYVNGQKQNLPKYYKSEFFI